MPTVGEFNVIKNYILNALISRMAISRNTAVHGSELLGIPEGDLVIDDINRRNIVNWMSLNYGNIISNGTFYLMKVPDEDDVECKYYVNPYSLGACQRRIDLNPAGVNRDIGGDAIPVELLTLVNENPQQVEIDQRHYIENPIDIIGTTNYCGEIARLVLEHDGIDSPNNTYSAKEIIDRARILLRHGLRKREELDLNGFRGRLPITVNNGSNLIQVARQFEFKAIENNYIAQAVGAYIKPAFEQFNGVSQYEEQLAHIVLIHFKRPMRVEEIFNKIAVLFVDNNYYWKALSENTMKGAFTNAVSQATINKRRGHGYYVGNINDYQPQNTISESIRQNPSYEFNSFKDDDTVTGSGSD